MRLSTHRGARLMDNTGARIVLWVITLPILFFYWHELEPMLTFRPVDAVVVGSASSKVLLRGRYSSRYYYTPWTFYRYEVRGTVYMGKQYRRTELMSLSSAALRLASSMPKGTKVRAWYNPLQPDEAVLSREPSLSLLLPATLGLVVMWLVALRRQR